MDQSGLLPIENVMVSGKAANNAVFTNLRGEFDLAQFITSDSLMFKHPTYQTTIVSLKQLKEHTEVLLSEKRINLSEIIISETRWKQKMSEVPNRISIIPASEVRLLNPQTAADLVGNSEEVFIQKSQLGGGSPMIRGFSTNRVLIAVDGIRMNNAIFRSGNLQNIISIDPFAIQSTEVCFGPGSVIYGSDAIGGVMSFNTLSAMLSDTTFPYVKGNVVSRFSSATTENTNHFDVNVGWKKWAFLTSYTYSQFGNLRMGSHGPDEYLRNEFVRRTNHVDEVITNSDPLIQNPTSYLQSNLMQKVRFKPNQRWDFNYSFIYSTTSDYARYDRLLRYKNGLPRSAEWYYGPQTWTMHSLEINQSSSNLFYDAFTTRIADQQFEESRNDRDFNSNVKHIRNELVDAYSANFDFLKNIGQHQQISYGIEGVYNEVTSTGIERDIVLQVDTVGPARYPKSTWNSYAAYMTYHGNISKSVLLSSGVRYNQFMLDATFDTTFYPFPFTKAKINQGALTGSLGLIFHPSEQFLVSYNLSTGFRSPNVDDLGKIFDSEPGAVVIPNPDLKAEYAYNMEAGITKLMGDFFKIDISVFYTILDNAMVRRDFQLNGMDSIVYDGELSKVQAIQNAAKAKVYGIQSGLQLVLPHGFGLISKLNYQKGDEELDDGTTSPLRHAAPFFGSTHFTFSDAKLRLDVSILFNSEISFSNLPEEEKGKDYMYATDGNGNPYSPAWYTLNFKALYQVTKNFALSSGIENITDQRYRPYSSGIVSPGRNFIFSLQARF